MIAASGKETLLQVENLHAFLPSLRGLVRAVDGISFTVAPGETLGLVGESGCGKSMLARAIMGLLPRGAAVSQGAVIGFQGRDLLTLSPKALRRIIGKEMAMIFQDPMTSLNPVMKAGRQIAEVAVHHLSIDKHTARERALTLLREVGISMPERRYHHYPHQLSGGLRQRVAIAIALACEPKLLIADEPTTALDVTVQAEILDLLAALQEQKGMAMMLITHDLGVMAGRTHATAVMYAGKIVEMAMTSRLFNHTAMPYTRALMDAVPRLADPPHTQLKAIAGQPPNLIDPPAGCRFAPRCGRALPRCKQEAPGLKRIDGQPHWFACWNPLDFP
jgi:peptide/nickel transport system ATP-binding protein